MLTHTYIHDRQPCVLIPCSHKHLVRLCQKNNNNTTNTHTPECLILFIHRRMIDIISLSLMSFQKKIGIPHGFNKNNSLPHSHSPFISQQHFTSSFFIHLNSLHFLMLILSQTNTSLSNFQTFHSSNCTHSSTSLIFIHSLHTYIPSSNYVNHILHSHPSPGTHLQSAHLSKLLSFLNTIYVLPLYLCPYN